MQHKKILILYNAIGLGHKSIAENIGYYLEEAGYEVKLEDILKVESNWLTDVTTFLYHIFITWLPFVWSFLYLNDWFTGILLRFRTRVGGTYSANLKMVIDSFEPDLIISTHTVPSAVVASLKHKGLYKGKFGIAFSDYHLHRYWLYEEADFYVVNIEEQKQQMVKLGFNSQKIAVCGMTLKPKLEVDAKAVKSKLGIGESESVLLVGSGSQGTGLNKHLLKNLSEHTHVKVVVMCGKNKKAFAELGDYFAGSNVLVLGFYTPMDELYAIADAFITKPGGLTVAEALRFNVPMIISHVLPGQEELNTEYLQDKGLIMPEAITIEGEAWEELETHAFKGHLLENAAKNALFPGPEVLLEAIESVI